MIYVNLTGRLGNQLFILEKLLLNIKDGEKSYINIYEYKNGLTADGQAIRFDAKEILIFPKNIVFIDSKFLYKISKRLSWIYKLILDLFNISHPHYRSDLFINLYFIKFLSGYFQNLPNQKVMIEKLIKKRFDIKDPKRLAIHFRQGDYKSSAHSSHFVVDEDVILKFLKQFDVNYRIDLYSDSDVDGLLEKIRGLGFSVSNMSDLLKTDIDIFYELTTYKNIFCSNSSFSWWAAHLFNDEKIIYLPSSWSKSYLIPCGLIHDRDQIYEI